MLTFCPTCANVLMVRKDAGGNVRYACQSCPYTYFIDKEITKVIRVHKKEVDDVLGGEDTWKNAQRTENTSCPLCGHNEAYFFEMQTRSADEPMSVFYKCRECSNIWKE